MGIQILTQTPIGDIRPPSGDVWIIPGIVGRWSRSEYHPDSAIEWKSTLTNWHADFSYASRALNGTDGNGGASVLPSHGLWQDGLFVDHDTYLEADIYTKQVAYYAGDPSVHKVKSYITPNSGAAYIDITSDILPPENFVSVISGVWVKVQDYDSDTRPGLQIRNSVGTATDHGDIFIPDCGGSMLTGMPRRVIVTRDNAKNYTDGIVRLRRGLHTGYIVICWYLMPADMGGIV